MFPILASSARSSSGWKLSISFRFGFDCNAASPRTACAWMLQSCCSWFAIFVTSVSKLIEVIGSACLKVEGNHFEFWDERGKNEGGVICLSNKVFLTIIHVSRGFKTFSNKKVTFRPFNGYYQAKWSKIKVYISTNYIVEQRSDKCKKGVLKTIRTYKNKIKKKPI